MAKFYGGPSKYLEQKRARFIHSGIMLAAGLALSYLTFTILQNVLRIEGLYSLIVSVILFLTFYSLKKHTWLYFALAKRFKLSIRAEDDVHKVLEGLPDTYSIIRDVYLPDAGIQTDFVVLGPNGLFSIEVKSHTGTVSWDGKQLLINGKPFDKDIYGQARAEATVLTDAIQASVDRHLFVNPILVFADPKARLKLGPYPIVDMAVIDRGTLVGYILHYNSRVVYAQAEIEQIVKLLGTQSSAGVTAAS